MKKFLTILSCLLLCVSLSGKGAHLTFKGIPISGSIDKFVAQMESQGYQLETSDQLGVVMTGTFAAQPGCTIFVLTSPKTGTVYSVSATFQEKATWKELKRQYNEYSELLTKKYGEPSFVAENFSNPYHEGDGMELRALKEDKCLYATYYRDCRLMFSI